MGITTQFQDEIYAYQAAKEVCCRVAMFESVELVSFLVMNMWIRPGRVTLIALIAVAAFSHACAEPSTPKRVLMVYQSEIYSPASWEFHQAVVSHLRSKLGRDTEFFSEQLEVNRFPESEGHALAWVRSRYAGRGIDIVIYAGSAFEELLPGVPTVYTGFNPFEVPDEAPNRVERATVWFKLDFTRTIAVARRLHPQANKVLVIAGAGFDDHVLLQVVRDELKGSNIPVEYLVDAPVDDLTKRVAQLPPGTIVLPVSYTRDMNGNIYYTPDVVASLSRASKAPVYAVADTTIGIGTVGGFVVDFDKSGAIVAEVVAQVLQGETGVHMSVPPEGAASYIFDWRQLKRWGYSSRDLPAGSVIKFRVPTAWEQYRWRIVAIIALVVTQFVLIAGLLISRRSRRRAETSLRNMTGRLLESQDDERRRIARDLHDGTGQHLSGMALTIGQVLADFPPGHDRLQQLLQDSHTASRQALDEVRTISFVLHPPILDGVGLVSALQWYVDGLRRRTDVRISLIAPTDLGHLEPEAERALFRMVQEGITNVLRHSGGTNLKIVLTSNSRAVTLVIEDNGHGLNAEQLSHLEGAATLGVGIAGMRERIRQLHGEFKLQSTADGTTVTATVPLERKGYAADHAGR